MPNVKILVLTKSKSVDRQKNITEEFEKMDVPFEFFYGLSTKPKFKGLTAKETNCSLNHFAMSEYARTSCPDVDFFIFLEDDVCISEDFLTVLNDLEEIQDKQKFDVLLLGTFIKSTTGENLVHKTGLNEHTIGVHNYFYLPDYSQYYGAHGYCVPKESLKDLQRIRHYYRTHADAWSYFSRNTTLDILHVYPHVAEQDSNFISLIGEHSLMPF